MIPDALGKLAAHMGPAALAMSFLAGLAFSFNPVALAAIPISIAYVTKARERGEAVAFGATFLFGMIAIQVILGWAAGLGGEWAKSFAGRQWGLLVGPLLIGLGLVWTGWVRLPVPRLALRAKRPTGLAAASLLGAAFAVAVCPFCTPALVVLLGAAAGLGSPWFGAALLLAFAVGRAIPLAAGAVSTAWLQTIKGGAAFARTVELAGAATLILTGVYMLNAYFFWIPALAA